MDTARDVMERPRCVPVTASLHEVAELLLNEHLDGVCVTDADGRMVGILTAMDLVFQEKRPKVPTMLYFVDAVIPLGSLEKSKREVRRIMAVTVEELMVRDVVTVTPDARIDEIATRMVEDHLTILPVVEGDEVVGMITKPSLLRAVHHLAQRV